jgi:hypothetical protein
MNRSINILLLVFSMPAIAFCIFVGFDIPMDFLQSSGASLPYREKVFLVLAGLLLILIARRAVNRWVGVRMTSKPERFEWCVEIGNERKKQVRLYLIIETVLALFFASTTYALTPDSWPLTIAYGLLFLDQLLFLIIAPSWFRVGVTQKAVVVADREIRVLYFSGLRRIELHQQTVYFEYIEELQLFFPKNCVPDGAYSDFRQAIEKQVNRDRVFFSEKFKNLV